MKKYFVLALVAVLVSCLSQIALAQDDPDEKPGSNYAQTFLGPTGLITVPVAFVTPRGNLGASAMMAEEASAASLNYGIGDFVEVGATHISIDDGDDETIVNAKVHVVPANFSFASLGLGTIDPFDSMDDSYYVVASTNRLPLGDDDFLGFRAHLGYGTGVYGENPIGGGELVINQNFTAIGEYDGSRTNWALRYNHRTQPIIIQAGILDSDFFAGLTAYLSFD